MKQTSFNVFKNVSLTIEPKDVVSIVGANGAGKSTLLDIILGFKKPTSGQIDYGIVFESSPTEKIGISYQKNIFLDTLSI
jgi:ABC-type multidrug transport system ATPase subunit